MAVMLHLDVRLKSKIAYYRSPNMGHKHVLRLNMSWIPIAHKYREGKVESTLERELNVPATAADQANETLE